MNKSIGCNIVDPLCDKEDQYTFEVYLRNIPLYCDYGFSHLEFSHVMAINEDEAKYIRDFSLERGIIPWSIHTEHLNEAGIDSLEDYLKVQEQCIKTAKALGAYVCVCHIPNIEPWGRDLKRDIEILKRLADITGKYELKLAIETPPYEYIIEIVDTINRDNVGINLDTGHTFLQGKNPANVARAIGKRLFTTHLQDNFGINDDHQPPGLGKIEWREVLDALKDIDYNGPLMLELTGKEVKNRRSDKYLRDYPLEKEIIFAKNYLEYILKT